MKRLVLLAACVVSALSFAALPATGSLPVGLVSEGPVLLDGGTPTQVVLPSSTCVCSVSIPDSGTVHNTSCLVSTLADGGGLVTFGGNKGDMLSFICIQ